MRRLLTDPVWGRVIPMLIGFAVYTVGVIVTAGAPVGPTVIAGFLVGGNMTLVALILKHRR